MALGFLAQATPAATTSTLLYTSPANTKGLVQLIVTNRDGGIGAFRASVGVDGEALADKQYIAYDLPIEGHDSIASVPFSLNSDDVVRVYSDSGLISFALVALPDTSYGGF